mgnify:CR=1 FL=1
MLSRRHVMYAALLSSGLPNMAWSQATFPSKPLRIVVPFGAGGVADLTARAVAQQLSINMGQAVVIDNRPGAGGIVAAELVAKAEPDGHTLLLMSNGTAVSAGLFKALPFNPRTDFAPVSLLGLFDIAIVVPESSPHKSLAELIGFGRANPGQLNIGTINIGSTQHLAAELLRTQANLIAQIIPYNGTPAVINALRGGQVDAVVNSAALFEHDDAANDADQAQRFENAQMLSVDSDSDQSRCCSTACGPDCISDSHVEVPHGNGHEPDGKRVTSSRCGRCEEFGEAIGVLERNRSDNFCDDAGCNEQPGQQAWVHVAPLPYLLVCHLYRVTRAVRWSGTHGRPAV